MRIVRRYARIGHGEVVLQKVMSFQVHEHRERRIEPSRHFQQAQAVIPVSFRAWERRLLTSASAASQSSASCPATKLRRSARRYAALSIMRRRSSAEAIMGGLNRRGKKLCVGLGGRAVIGIS